MKCRWCGKEITKEQSEKYEGHCGEYHMEANWQVESIFCIPKQKEITKERK